VQTFEEKKPIFATKKLSYRFFCLIFWQIARIFVFLHTINECKKFMVRKSITKQEIIEKLSDLWTPLSEEQREEVWDHICIHHYKKNENIYKENESPYFMMCLLSGKVKIYINGMGGRAQIIRMIREGEYFAYRANFAGENYVTNAAAFDSAIVCAIPMTLISKLTQQNHALSLFFIRQLSKDLGIADARTVALTQKHVRGRLAESLLLLKENYGLEEDDSTLSIYLSREDLASLSNMTTANAIRTLSNFANERIIAIDGRKIKLIDLEEIKRISKSG
jgi:CRP-like cAMP-binding protein